MDLEFVFKSRVTVRRVRSRSKSSSNRDKMVLGYDTPVSYSEDHMTDTYMTEVMPVKTEEKDGRNCSPFSYTVPDMGVYTGESALTTSCRKTHNRSPFSAFCPSPAGAQDSQMAVMKKLFVGDFDTDPLTSWTTKHPQNWTKGEVLDWIFYVVEQENLDGSRVKGEAYRNHTGADLIRMSREDFMAIDPMYGLKMYQTFRNLVSDVIFEKPQPVPHSTTLDTFNQINHCQMTSLTRKICQDVFGDPFNGGGGSGGALNDCSSSPWGTSGGHTVTSHGSSDHNASSGYWYHEERVKPAGGHLEAALSADRAADCKNSTKPGHQGANDLVIHKMENDVKVDVRGLGTYSIGTGFSMTFPPLDAAPSFSTASNRLFQATSYTAPISPVSPSTLPQFESLSPGTFTPTPLSSPVCSDSMSSWFSGPSQLSIPNSAIDGFHTRPSQGHARNAASNLAPTFEDGFNACEKTSLPSSSSSSSSTKFSSSLSSSSSSSSASYCSTPSEHFTSPDSHNNMSSYHVQKETTMTRMTTLCKRSIAVVGPTCHQTQSEETRSASWTYSASLSSSSLKQQHPQQSHFPSPKLSSSLSTSSSLSSSTCRGSVDSIDQEDVLFVDEEKMEDGVSEVPGTNKKKTPRRSRNNTAKTGNHLWEFVRDLLRDPNTNPRLLKWEDKENGVFRFVQSEQVARLWGEKKNNPLMTYEKLSRAMRFCRKAGYFHQVPKTGKFPKKLCFMFGAKAYGWKD